jgi:hypothetical protein
MTIAQHELREGQAPHALIGRIVNDLSSKKHVWLRKVDFRVEEAYVPVRSTPVRSDLV